MVSVDFTIAVIVAITTAGFIYLDRRVSNIITFSQSETYPQQNFQDHITQQQEIRNEVMNLRAIITAQEETTKKQANEIEILHTQLKEAQKGQDGKAVTYNRWGREDCPNNDTELVYKGYAGGSWYEHVGGTAEYVCLPSDPLWGTKNNLRSYAPGLIYGVEYEDELLFDVPDKNREAPCAVCRNSGYSTLLMIPARTQCYPGWKEAYRGYLASGYHGHKSASQYVCVDEHPQQVIGGGNTDDNGKLFYQVRTRCGSLKCPPYINDRALSCVVCMK